MKSLLLSVLALVCLAAPVLAQDEDKMVLDDLRIKFVKPSNYTRAKPEEVRFPMRFVLRSPTSPRYNTTREENGVLLTRSIVGGIFLMVLPKKKTGLESDTAVPDVSAGAAEALGKIVPGLAVQNSAKIKVAGRDALALLASLDLQQRLGIQEEGTVRLILVNSEKQLLIWGFGAMSADFSEQVKSFEKMMATVKYMDDPEPKPTKKK